MNIISQFKPPAPKFTEDDVPDLTGKVCLVTGANGGVGKHVASILYSKNATVYATSRTEKNGTAVVAAIKDLNPSSNGRMEYLHLDLADLTTIKDSVNQFLGKETQLHLLFNNAGVMTPPKGSKTVQGYEEQLGINCLGSFLFTRLLTPILVKTVMSAEKGSVRVIWVSSSAAELVSPKHGVEIGSLNSQLEKSPIENYGSSKAGVYYYGTEFARRNKTEGLISVPLNPGNLTSDLDRHVTDFLSRLIRRVTTYPAVNGAYTELFAACSPEVTLDKSGEWIAPWGRFLPIRKDLLRGARLESEGGTGIAQKFWEWSEEQLKAYV